MAIVEKGYKPTRLSRRGVPCMRMHINKARVLSIPMLTMVLCPMEKAKELQADTQCVLCLSHLLGTFT